MYHSLQHEGGPTRDGVEHEGAKPERNNQANTSKECPPRWITGRSRADGAICFPDDASSDGIHFDRPRGVEWLNDVFQRHISALEAELLETA